MKYEKIHDVNIPKIGFGTWGIGGNSHPDPSMDERSRKALRSALETGYTHFDTAEAYANGHSEELIGQVIKETGANRENLFITTKISPEHLHYNDVLKSCEGSLRRMQTDYIDLYLIHWPSQSIPLNETFRALNQLVKDGKVRHLGVSNFNMKKLVQAQELSETPLLTDQVPYSLPNNTYVENRVLEYCQQNDILLTAYSPVKFRDLNVNDTIGNIAEAHDSTPYQIALAWLVAQPRVITIPKSINPDHITDNFAAAEIELRAEELEQLNNLY